MNFASPPKGERRGAKGKSIMEQLKRSLEEKKLFVFDMDGTVYLGTRVFPYAAELIRLLRESGRRILFFTNNASHNPVFYMEKLKKMGFDPQPGEMLTAGTVTAAYLTRHHAGKPVYLVGTPELEEQFAAEGIELSEDADIVVSSFDTTLTYRKLEIACRLIRKGALWLSTHPDFNCPTEDGFIPDSGAITAFIHASTGKEPICFGKPHEPAIRMMCEVTGVRPEEAVIFGDRLYTDIALGKKNGVTAVLVLTGETTEEDIARAAEEDRPDAVVPSLDTVKNLLFRK